jgi:arginine deiminase
MFERVVMKKVFEILKLNIVGDASGGTEI